MKNAINCYLLTWAGTRSPTPPSRALDTAKTAMAPKSDKTNWADESNVLTVTVLGCTGDLAKKKTYPALFALFLHEHMPPRTVVLGYARSPLTDESLRERIRPALKGPKDQIEAFLASCFFQQGEYGSDDARENAESDPPVFGALGDRVATLEASRGVPGCRVTGHRIFYLALPPSVYPPVCANIKRACMSPTGWTRIVVEKPFGKDLQSSEELSAGISELFTEAQLYRIDHYLGKELTQNLVVMRFANRFLAPLWNRDNIANVQILFKEPFGTQGRGGYFDQYGIIRDIIQNHLLQLLCLVAMEKPCSLSPDDIRDEKLKVLRCIEPVR